MPDIYRSAYDPRDLDAPTGPPPAYSNPGAIGRPMHPNTSIQRRCRIHDVTWKGDAACWICFDEEES